MSQNNTLEKVQMKSSALPKARFNWSHDVNTTFNFGTIQPVVCKWLPPNTKTTMSLRNLVRLAPLSAPAFARIKYKTFSHYVAISDLFQDFPHLLSNTPLARGQNLLSIEKLPHLPLALLSFLVLIGAKCSVYHSPTTAWASDNSRVIHRVGVGGISEQDALTIFDTLFNNTNLFTFNHHSVEFPHFVGTTLNLSAIYGNRYGDIANTALKIPLLNTDKISFFDVASRWNSTGNRSAIDNNDVATIGNCDMSIDLVLNGYAVTLCFNLSDFGKRLYTALVGCGYQIDFQSKTKVSLVPLFALWKSYFDDFGVLLYDNYFSTNLYKLLTHIDYYNAVDLTNLYAHTEFISFVNDLGNMWATDQQNYTSAHIESTAISPSFGLSKSFIDVDGDANITEVDNYDVNNLQINGHSFIDAVKHGHLDSEYLRRIYLCTNRRTVLGRAVADILRAQGQGDFVDNTKGHFIGYEETDISIDAVVSQSDTFSSTDNSGKVLGDYAGLGVGSNYAGNKQPKTFTYENDEFGYWITLGVVMPESGYCQALDGSLLAIDRNSLFNPEFDALGYEATRKQQIVGAHHWCENPTEATEANTLDATFGYIPRYTGLKIQTNKFNGGFSLGSVRNSYQQYTLDKLINVGDKQVSNGVYNSNAGYTSYDVYELLTPSRLPTASIVWRYISRYAFLGNLNRIFAYVGVDPSNVHELFDSNDAVEELRSKFEYLVRTEDNFMIHHVVNMIGFAPMKPIERSFETFEDGEQPNMSATKA